MRKRTLWKDIRVTLKRSRGRFVSIVSLMLLGSFALVGLYVTGPDIQVTGERFFRQHNLADITVVSEYGLTDEDERIISGAPHVKTAEFGYFKDVVIAHSDYAIRVYSAPSRVSMYEVVEGRMPQAADEIALAEHNRDSFAIDSSIDIDEKANLAGKKTLKGSQFTVVGFVRSSEAISPVNMGHATAGTGEIKSYAVVVPEAFDSNVRMIGRVTFTDTQTHAYWTSEYNDKVQAHKHELTQLLAHQPQARREGIIADSKAQIEEAQKKVDDGYAQLDAAQKQLDEAAARLAEGKKELNAGTDRLVNEGTEAIGQISSATAQLNSAQATLMSAQTQLIAASQKLSQGYSQLDRAWADLSNGKVLLDQARTQLETLRKVLDTLRERVRALPASHPLYSSVSGLLTQAEDGYNKAIAQYNSKLSEYYQGLAQWNEAVDKLDHGSQGYQNHASEIAQAFQLLAQKQTQLSGGVSSGLSSTRTGISKLIQGQRALEEGEKEYAKGKEEFDKRKEESLKTLQQAQVDIDNAKAKLDKLDVPAYRVDNRREGLTSQGYLQYESISHIIARLANIFPVFLYLVAALVTFTTMGRMVDEERMQSGVLKALGYSNRDVLKKFTVYGFVSSTVGTILGVAAGHTFLPLFACYAYKARLAMPWIDLQFHPLVTVVALVLAWISAVVPAWMVAFKELRQKPAVLLLPKPPAVGARILLERVGFIWTRLSFTQKVTARNIFRYKTRMFMTILGVAGAVALLSAGLGVQSSIRYIGDKQFGDIIHYDLIVTQKDDNTDEQIARIDESRTDDAVRSTMDIRYEKFTKVAGESNDKQSISAIITSDPYNLGDYISLENRESGRKVVLTDKGVIISERIARMTNARVGHDIRITDSNGVEHDVRVDGIAHMYIGHFMFMTARGYKALFHKDYAPNAFMVRLKDASVDNAKAQGSRFMQVDGVRSVVQNTISKSQVALIVKSLDQVMMVLVAVATLLTVVILYNLNNLNVSERIRELSTIKVLGFHSSETTLYIYRETIVLSLFGILLGYVGGAILHHYIIVMVPPDEVMFAPGLVWFAYVIPAVVVSVILGVLGWLLYKRLRTVDMLGALKSVE